MSTSSAPSRLLAGLASAAATVGLITLPAAAFAEATPTPEPRPAATSSPSPRSTPTEPTASPTDPSGPASSTPPASEPPDSPAASPSPHQSEPESADPSSDAASPSPDETTGAQGSGDSITVPGPTESPAPASELAAQAVAGPSVTLSKSVTPTRVSRVGQVVTYTFRATNNGSVALSDVGISDELEGLRSTCPTSGSVTAATLAPGQAVTCTATLTVTQAVLDFGDLFNFATVFGSYPVPEAPDDYVGANAAARVVVDQSPSIALRASVSPSGTADRGDRLRYTGTATNTGNVTLTGARITSSLSALDLDCEPSARATLAPGATISCAGSYRVTSGDARRGRVSTELTARAERPFGETSTRSDDVTDDVRLRVAVTKPPAAADHGLADTGGPALPLGLAGLAAVTGGLILLRRTRRT